ncbi:hypothetical protein ACROYT_G013659 [Oculina patagonica]
MGTSATSAFSTTGTNLNDQAIANLPSSVTQEYKPAVVEPEQVNEEATDASKEIAENKGTEIKRADECTYCGQLVKCWKSS